MDDESSQSKALELVDGQLNELHDIMDRYSTDRDYESAEERLRHWKDVTVQLIHDRINPKESQKLGRKKVTKFLMTDPYQFPLTLANIYETFLQSLREAIQKHPEVIIKPLQNKPIEDSISSTSSETISNRIFIIHGHDELNRLRLEKLLKERWKLDPIVMSDQAGKGRTLIEKFEQEATGSSFAIALMTPDDQIAIKSGDYAQARPNAIFELGWFYGRLGRNRVCILFKEGTEIHSDLDGISTIRFKESIEEKITELESEFHAAGLVGS
jgi:predicted nucleotide-binding protein